MDGQVGLTICPGRQGSSWSGGEWCRDLEADVRAIRDWGASIVVTLMETAELEQHSASGLGDAIRSGGMMWAHLPIRDTRTPDPRWLEQWRQWSPVLHELLERGGKLLVHCRGGLERSALAACLLLCERGEPLGVALQTVVEARPDARLLPDQRAYLEGILDQQNIRKRQFRACLLGGAIGDALGAEIEFWPLQRIRSRFPYGLQNIPRYAGVQGAITDDTQMTLFLAEGLIGATRMHSRPDSASYIAEVHRAFLRWLLTQGKASALCVEQQTTGLAGNRRLNVRRAPGNTCLEALQSAHQVGAMARNNSKGCGTVMRTAPVGLYFEARDIPAMAAAMARLTHGHPAACDAAIALSWMIYELLHGRDLEAAVGSALNLDIHVEVREAITRAMSLGASGSPDIVEKLGGGWVATEALSIALYATRCANDFGHGLQIAVMHSGDSDSTGAIAGQLLGLIMPNQVIRHRWRRRIQCADLVCATADELYAAKYGHLE